MRLAQSLGWRLVVVALVSGLVGVGLARRLTSGAGVDVLAEGFVDQMAAGDLARCERDPASWSLRFGSGFRAFAFDGESLRSAHPEAPSIDASLAAQARRVGQVAAGRLELAGGRRLVVRVAPAGPCALIMASWPARQLVLRVAPALGWGALVTALLGAGLGLLVVARPLGRRAVRLRELAVRVGGGRLGPPVAANDELAEVEAGLVRADARIASDAAEMHRRAGTLERHLEFIAHDLRTPLASLLLALEQAADVSPAAEARELIGGALRDCLYVTALINDLRDAARLEGGWDPRAAVGLHDLRPALLQVVGRARVLARRREIELEHAIPDEPLLVRCDPLAWERVVENLTINAVLHNAPGGHVALVLVAQPGGFVLRVIDDGPGIPPPMPDPLASLLPGAPTGERRGQGLPIVAALCARSGWSFRLEAQQPGLLVRVELAGGNTDLPAGAIAAQNLA